VDSAQVEITSGAEVAIDSDETLGAAKTAMAGPNANPKKRDQTPVIWAWHKGCKSSRRKNFEAKHHDIGPGGCSEGDWRSSQG